MSMYKIKLPLLCTMFCYAAGQLNSYLAYHTEQLLAIFQSAMRIQHQ